MVCQSESPGYSGELPSIRPDPEFWNGQNADIGIIPWVLPTTGTLFSLWHAVTHALQPMQASVDRHAPLGALIVGMLLPEREVMRVFLEDAEGAGNRSRFRCS